jgi:hypothetical protein
MDVGSVPEPGASGVSIITVFGDESRLFGIGDCGSERFWRGDGNVTEFHHKWKCLERLMAPVWGRGTGRDVIPSRVLCPKSITAAEELTTASRSRPLEICDAWVGPSRRFFMQDRAPTHQVRVTMDSLSQCIQFLPDWPTTRDLNPKDMIWSVMGGKQFATESGSAVEILASMREIWDPLCISTSNRLVAHLRHRLKVVVQMNGSSSSALLLSHTRTPRQSLIRPGGSSIFDPLEDAALLSSDPCIGRKQDPFASCRARAGGSEPLCAEAGSSLSGRASSERGTSGIVRPFRPMVADWMVIRDAPAQDLDEEDDGERKEYEEAEASADSLLSFCLPDRQRMTAPNPDSPPHRIPQLRGQKRKRLCPAAGPPPGGRYQSYPGHPAPGGQRLRWMDFGTGDSWECRIGSAPLAAMGDLPDGMGRASGPGVVSVLPRPCRVGVRSTPVRLCEKGALSFCRGGLTRHAGSGDLTGSTSCISRSL